MAIKVIKLLVGTVALAALMSAAAGDAMAKGPGGGHGGGFSGGHGGGFSGARGFGGARGFSGGRMGPSSGAHFRSSRTHGLSTHGRNFSGKNFAGKNVSGKNFAGKNFAGKNFSGKNFSAKNFAGMSHFHKTGWNNWGNPYWKAGWNGGWNGCCGYWWGPVFWPYFYGDLLAFVFWPFGPVWYDPFWAYGPFFVWDAIFWPGPYYAYAYGPPYYDVYADYGYAHNRSKRVRYATREATGSVRSNTELAQGCGGLAPGVTDLPIARIETTLQLNDEQLKTLDALKAASSQAGDILKASCSSEIAMTPVRRLDAVQKRTDSMIQAVGIVRTPLDNFYNLLNEQQRQRFATLGPASRARAARRGSASANDLAALCSRSAEGFAQPPVERIEQAIKPTQQQQDALEKLKSASAEAANQLQASCPAEVPPAPIDRFDAVAKRLEAMATAIKTMRPALDSFYASLSDEQKARFNTLAPPKTTASGRS
ncbi:MAG TPA: Spy/CpxP family protein refolding chaperone [Pseudolabrys sp.]